MRRAVRTRAGSRGHPGPSRPPRRTVPTNKAYSLAADLARGAELREYHLPLTNVAEATLPAGGITTVQPVSPTGSVQCPTARSSMPGLTRGSRVADAAGRAPLAAGQPGEPGRTPPSSAREALAPPGRSRRRSARFARLAGGERSSTRRVRDP